MSAFNKGKPCIYQSFTLCQENDCENCGIYCQHNSSPPMENGSLQLHQDGIAGCGASEMQVRSAPQNYSCSPTMEELLEWGSEL